MGTWLVWIWAIRIFKLTWSNHMAGAPLRPAVAPIPVYNHAVAGLGVFRGPAQIRKGPGQTSIMDDIRAEELRAATNAQAAPVAGVTQAPTGMLTGPDGVMSGGAGLFQAQPFKSSGSTGHGGHGGSSYGAGTPRDVDQFGNPMLRPGAIGNVPNTIPSIPVQAMGSLDNPITNSHYDIPQNAVTPTKPKSGFSFFAKGGFMPPDGVTITGENGPEVTVNTPFGRYVIPAQQAKTFFAHAQQVLDEQKKSGGMKYPGQTPESLMRSVAMAYVPKPDGPGAPPIAPQVQPIPSPSPEGGGFHPFGFGQSAPIVAPVNPYMENPNMPSPRGMTPNQRYFDMGHQLAALRAQAHEEGRQAVQAVKDSYRSEAPSGITDRQEGALGKRISGSLYGTGSITNAPVPKDFPIVHPDGSVTHTNSIADFAKENAIEQATRHVQGFRNAATNAATRAAVEGATPQVGLTGSVPTSAVAANYPAMMPIPSQIETRGTTIQQPDIGAPLPKFDAVAPIPVVPPNTGTAAASPVVPAITPAAAPMQPSKTAETPISPTEFKAEEVPGYQYDKQGGYFKLENGIKNYVNPTDSEFKEARKKKSFGEEVPFFGPGNELPNLFGPMAKK